MADIGCGEYTKAYFSEKRYTFLCNSSAGHNVAIIDGMEQSEGKERKGEILKQTEDYLEISMGNAYVIDTLDRYIRRFYLSDDRIKLVDTFQFKDTNAHTITERFVSLIQPVQKGDQLYVDKMELRCERIPKITKTTIKDHSANDLDVFLIDYVISDKLFEIEFFIYF